MAKFTRDSLLNIGSWDLFGQLRWVTVLHVAITEWKEILPLDPMEEITEISRHRAVRDGEMVQRVRACIAFPEDMDSIPSIHMAAHSHL